jgi:hypothetical protein
MKKLLVCLVFLALIAGCKSAFVWDPTGVWTVNITYVAYGLSYGENFSFTGTDTSGTVTGYTVYGALSPQTGTYTKSGDYTITIHYDFWGYGDHLIFDFSGTSTEASPNTMSGTGTWYLNGYLHTNLTWTATKTTNLQ